MGLVALTVYTLSFNRLRFISDRPFHNVVHKTWRFISDSSFVKSWPISTTFALP